MDKESKIKEIFGKLATIGKIVGFKDYKNIPYAVEFYVQGKKLTFYQTFNPDFTHITSCALSLERGWNTQDFEKIVNFLEEQKAI